MTRQKRPGGAWHLVDIVQADRQGRRRRTADRWPDTWRWVMSCPTESASEPPDRSD